MSIVQELPSGRLCELWFSRAQECRTLAESFHHPQRRDRMLRVAEEYDRMARWAAERVVVEDQHKTAKRQAASIA